MHWLLGEGSRRVNELKWTASRGQVFRILTDFLSTCTSVSIRIVLDLQKKFQKWYGEFPYAGLALLIASIRIFVTINEPTLTHKIYKSMLYSDFLNFYLKSFLCSGIPSRYHVAFGCHVSQASFRLWQFLGLYCQVFRKMSFSWDLSCIFLMITNLWKGRPHRKKRHFYSIISRIQTIISTTHRWLPALVIWLRDCQVAPRGHGHSLFRSRSARPALRAGGVLLSWGVRVYTDYLEPSAQEVCLFSPFTRSIVYLHHYGLRYFICWVIIQ